MKTCLNDNCKYYKELLKDQGFIDYCLLKDKEIKYNDFTNENCEYFKQFKFCDTCKHNCGEEYIDDYDIDIDYRCDLQNNKLIFNQCCSILQTENCPIECPIGKWEEY